MWQSCIASTPPQLRPNVLPLIDSGWQNKIEGGMIEVVTLWSVYLTWNIADEPNMERFMFDGTPSNCQPIRQVCKQEAFAVDACLCSVLGRANVKGHLRHGHSLPTFIVYSLPTYCLSIKSSFILGYFDLVCQNFTKLEIIDCNPPSRFVISSRFWRAHAENKALIS